MTPETIATIKQLKEDIVIDTIVLDHYLDELEATAPDDVTRNLLDAIENTMRGIAWMYHRIERLQNAEQPPSPGGRLED